jgi:hypothetical protein
MANSRPKYDVLGMSRDPRSTFIVAEHEPYEDFWAFEELARDYSHSIFSVTHPVQHDNRAIDPWLADTDDRAPSIASGKGAKTAADTTAPTLKGILPSNGSKVATDADLMFNFSEAVKAGIGNIVLVGNDGSQQQMQVISITDATQVSISGTTITIDPSVELLANAKYTVTVTNDAAAKTAVVEDLAGNDYAGLSGYTFTTGAAPSSVQ